MSQKTSPKPAKLSVALLASGTLVAIVAQLFLALPARADCNYAGRTYKTGDVDGSLVCMPDGTMQPNG